MKTLRRITLFVIAAVAGASPLAGARPFAIDQHGASCTSSDPSSVSYDASGITAVKANAVVVCPLSAIAMPTDQTSSLYVRLQVKTYTTGSMSCTFESSGSTSQAMAFNPTPGVSTSGTIGPVDAPIFPHDGTAPVRVDIVCTLATVGSSILSLQVESMPSTPPAPPAPQPIAGIPQ